MANIASAQKKNRQRLRRRARNLFHLSTMRSHVKRVRAAIEAEDVDAAKAALVEASKLIDKTAQKGAIKKQTAARKVSRLARAVNGLSG